MDYPNYKYMEESSNNHTEESKNDYFKINNDNNEKEIENCKNKINKPMKNMKILIISLRLVVLWNIGFIVKDIKGNVYKFY